MPYNCLNLPRSPRLSTAHCPNIRPTIKTLFYGQLPTAEQTSRTAYELLTAPSAGAAGVAQAPSGRQTRKHVCLHPGCGKVFHLKASATAHQEKEHRFRRHLGEVRFPTIGHLCRFTCMARCLIWKCVLLFSGFC